MQQRRGGEELIELGEVATAAGRVRRGGGTGNVLDAGEQVGQGIVGGAGGGAVKDFVGVVEAEGNEVAILEFPAFDFFVIDEEAATLAAILDVVLVGLYDDRGAIAGDAAVRELEMIAG